MNQRNQGGGPPRGPGHFDHPHDRDRYASRHDEYENMPSVTNREWDPSQAAPDNSFGHPGIESSGDLRGGEARGRAGGDREQGQGGYGQDQGRHAQSGHGRGGSQFAQRDVRYAQGPDSPRQSQRGRGPLNYLRSDKRIADDLIDRLTDDDQLDASEILVMVENGVATLTGEVPARWMKRHAEEIAARVSGMRDVRNQLIVDPGVKSFGPPGAAVRSGDQYGSGFSSSTELRDADAER
ncbi:MAG: BON domain-containing protein [Pseudomonadota bacterium]|nr:BON domain-containing protein [Pseudomonadota bacterium]